MSQRQGLKPILIQYVTVLHVGTLGQLNWFLCFGFHKAKKSSWVDQLGSPPGRLWEKSASKFISVINKIQFPLFVGLMSPFPCWLSAGGCPWFLETFSGLCKQPQHLRTSNSIWILHSCNLCDFCYCCFLLIPPRESSLHYRLMWLDWAHPGLSTMQDIPWY